MKIALIIFAVAIIGIIAFAVSSNMTSTLNTTVASSVIAGDAITVTISGEIYRPGTYTLDAGTKMIDLITAAGGVNTNADPLAYNAECVLKAKGTYYIAPVYDNSNTCAVSPIQKANVNTATAEILQSIAGFGKAVSTSLVNYRKDHPFMCLEEIKDVNGIGDATYMSVRDKITLRDAE